MSTTEASLLATTTSESERSDTESTTINKPKWTHWHTLWAIAIRMLGDILYKNIIVFYKDYSDALHLTMQQFSIVVICQQFGALLAMLLLPLFTRVFPSLNHKICVSGILCGLFSILTVLSVILFDPERNDASFIFIWTCLARLLFSMSFYVYITSILDLASQCNDENSGKQGKIIALLNLSWSIASLSYFVTGFTITWISWWFSFVLYGLILCTMSLGTYFIFARFNHYGTGPGIEHLREEVPSTAKHRRTPSWMDSIKSVICTKVSTLIFTCSILMGFFTTSFGIIVASVWFEGIYGLNSFQVGLVAIAIFVGELSGSFALQPLIDTYGVYKCCIMSYGSLLSACIITYVLNMMYGPAIGGMFVAIIILYMLYFGWESIFIQQQILCIQNSPSRNHTSLMLMTNFVFSTLGAMVGSYIDGIAWENGEGMGMIILVWIGCIVALFLIYGGLYFMTLEKRSNNRTRKE